MRRLVFLTLCLGVGLGVARLPETNISGRELTGTEASLILGGGCGTPTSADCGATAACTGSTGFCNSGVVNCNLTGLNQGCSSNCSVWSGQNCACNG